ncbi:hypothetical protein E7T06_12950 [Deinococcus sp. Arct2-2]|uniref:WGxxGxxG family protein n=1 Tax=Deinococcus sp. Arct2-2 TaxID=2568653 RepID=UPI0010A4B3E1|nr:WGxxGxxG family protein [Deinococcus sp. Arct2-2]THF69179.1 hypothetical protein E7T06_12950 [Deinococcus sp. Arct2-2]
MNIKTALLLGTLVLASPALAQDTTDTTATDTATTTTDNNNDDGFNWGWLGLLGLAGLAGLRREPERERIVTPTTAQR